MNQLFILKEYHLRCTVVIVGVDNKRVINCKET